MQKPKWVVYVNEPTVTSFTPFNTYSAVVEFIRLMLLHKQNFRVCCY